MDISLVDEYTAKRSICWVCSWVWQCLASICKRARGKHSFIMHNKATRKWLILLGLLLLRPLVLLADLGLPRLEIRVLAHPRVLELPIHLELGL